MAPYEPETPMSREEFLAWVDRQPPGRFERIDGIVVAMAPVENSDFVPDAILRCGPRLPDEATRVPDPLVLVEVLSPDSGTRDRATKLRAYFKLPTVRHYLIVWPDEPRIVRHSRREDGDIATQVFAAGEICLDPPGITLTVEEFYSD